MTAKRIFLNTLPRTTAILLAMLFAAGNLNLTNASGPALPLKKLPAFAAALQTRTEPVHLPLASVGITAGQTVRVNVDNSPDPNSADQPNPITVELCFHDASGDLILDRSRLITRGGDPNEVDDNGISILGLAAIANHADTVAVLLKRGARVNLVDKFGMTPLMYAASVDFGDTAAARKLIAAGADLNAKNKDGLTPLDLARKYNHRALEDLLSARAAAR